MNQLPFLVLHNIFTSHLLIFFPLLIHVPLIVYFLLRSMTVLPVNVGSTFPMGILNVFFLNPAIFKNSICDYVNTNSSYGREDLD